MLTKYILHIDGGSYELRDDDLRNWDAIKCSYKREDYGGVVRSFSSQFEFVNRAYVLLRDAYLRDRFNTEASIEVMTANDRWIYETRFECPLDFSTIEWDSCSLKLNAVDNSLAAVIKANKSTKYELGIDSDIVTDAVFNFDRLPVRESLTYEITGGTSFDDCADLSVVFRAGENPYIGNVGYETSINLAIDWNDDQTDDAGSYIFRTEKDIEVTFDFDITWRGDEGYGTTDLYVCVRRNGHDVDGAVTNLDGGYNTTFLAGIGAFAGDFLGTYPDPDGLAEAHPYPVSGQWALVGGTVWAGMGTGHSGNWVNTGKTKAEYFKASVSGKRKLTLKAGDQVYIPGRVSSSQTQAVVRVVASKFVFAWTGRGHSVDIPVMTPKKVASTLLKKMSSGVIETSVDISNFDRRMAKTYIFAAESARGIPGAKLYSSFNDFCDWMSAVFGYVYYIGAPKPSRCRDGVRVCGQYEWSPWSYRDETYIGPVNTSNIVYIPTHAKFLYLDNGILYAHWSGSDNYNDSVTGHPRTDTLFRISELSETDLYYFDEYDGNSLYPNVYDGSDDVGPDGKTVYFVHRSELLKPDAEVRVFSNCRDLKYKPDTGAIYSTVTAGYDKKDYDSINGRDEFNFSNSYSTGCSVSGKTLSLLSKYRADCYGMEFAVQKRGEDTTDNESDNAVFFVLCSKTESNLVPDRSISIENALSDSVFNGAFSPMACIRANAGVIGLQAESLTLKFASSTGNSSIVVGGDAMSGDIVLDTPLATNGTVEFTTDEMDIVDNENDLIEVASDGVVYRGYLQEVDLQYARTEAAQYKLIVKDIEL